MKYKLDYRFKRALLILFILASLIFLYIGIDEYFFIEYKTNTLERFRIDDRTTLNYKIHLVPDNILYETDILENSAVVSKYIDRIQVDYNYEFKDHSELDLDMITGGEILVEVEGYTGKGERYRNVFTKTFLKEDISKILNNNHSFSGSIDVAYQEYNAFIEALFKDSGLSCETRINVKLNLESNCNNDYKDINFKSEPYLNIPLKSSYLFIEGENEIKNEDNYEEIIKNEIPVNNNKTWTFWALFVVFMIISSIVYFKIEVTNKPDKLLKNIKKIFKQHGSLMVRLAYDIELLEKKEIVVSSFNDLVRICDELRKPIFFKDEKQLKNVKEFYLLDNETVYIYKVYPIEEDIEEQSV